MVEKRADLTMYMTRLDEDVPLHVFVDLEIHGRVRVPHPAVAAGAWVVAAGPATVLVAWLKALRPRLGPAAK